MIILVAPIPIWATTLMVQDETVYIKIYMKLKNIFSNSNRYFAVLIHCVHILYIYHIYIHYIIYMYVLYYFIYITYIYISGFFLLGDRG